MGKLPPSLEWVPEFVNSIERALDSQIDYRMKNTTNPLIFQLSMYLLDKLNTKSICSIYTIFNSYAHKNECVPYGLMVKNRDGGITIGIIVKRLLGPIRNEIP